MIPFAYGGPPESANLQLRCRAHNAYEADLLFGDQQALLMPENAAGDELGPDRVRVR